MSSDESEDERIIFVQFQMENEELQILTFQEVSELDILLDYDLVRKKILLRFGFIASGKDKIRLTIKNFYGKSQGVSIPIMNPKNWTVLVTDMLQR